MAGELSPLSPLPDKTLAELVSAVGHVRARHPMQTIAACDGEEEWGVKGPCARPAIELGTYVHVLYCMVDLMVDLARAGGLARLENVHLLIHKMQTLYAGKKLDTYEYATRRHHVKHFRRTLHLPGVTTVCEVGFNAGHGAAVWLEGTGVKLLQSFDLPLNAPAVGARNLSRALYPGRIQFHEGPTKQTLAPFVESVLSGQTPPCDLWYIDGLHTYQYREHYGPGNDMASAVRASRNGTIIIADDCTNHWAAVSGSWKQLLHPERVPHVVPNRVPWSVLPSRMAYNKTGWCAGEVVL
jgi:hypothetical protein